MVEKKVKSAKKENGFAASFKSTFRRHTGAEYSELLTRGIKGNKGVNRRRPWAYVRLFSLIFVLFAVFLLIVRFTSNELFVPTICVCAATFVNLPFLLLLFELYPNRDLSFMSVCLAMLLGGAAANIITQILFNIFTTSSPWLHAVYAGFFEELPKAAAVVLVIVVSRKSSPLAGFLLGAAVGCGFSIAEDMGYIFQEANELPAMNLTTIIEVSVARGVSALCTHTLWTAAIGWAYCHFSRHLANMVFYLVLLLSCGLHIAWDLPLQSTPVYMGLIYGGCAAVALFECCLILHFERKKVFEQNVLKASELYKNDGAVSEVWEQVEQDEQATKSMNKKDPLYWRHAGHIALALGAVLMAVVGVLYCSIPFRETYGTQTFSTKESFIEFMQDGMVFNAEDNRRYDEHNTTGDERPSQGRVVQSVQGENGVIYNYVYTENYDFASGKNYYFPETVYATVTTEEGTFTYHKEDLYNDGTLYASFFKINSDVTGYFFTPGGNVTVFINNPAFVRDLSDWKYLSLFVTFAV
ncbi:MAG: PrsW family intramembrane metalloprotease, partial [Clostridia bacterium]|nr:PrsW family intramembrane metalloprotease [Clostridia bacterium]